MGLRQRNAPILHLPRLDGCLPFATSQPKPGGSSNTVGSCPPSFLQRGTWLAGPFLLFFGMGEGLGILLARGVPKLCPRRKVDENAVILLCCRLAWADCDQCARAPVKTPGHATPQEAPARKNIDVVDRLWPLRPTKRLGCQPGKPKTHSA